MKTSLKRYLLINALIIIALSGLIAITSAFFLRYESAKQHLDAELSLEAKLIESVLETRLSHKRIKRIQNKIDALPEKNDHLDANQETVIKALASRSQFQVWDLHRKRLILSSQNAPKTLLTTQPGYQTIHTQNALWRTYSTPLPKLNYKIVTLQRYDITLPYKKALITDTLIVLSLSFSFLIFALWFIIQKALSSLDDTKKQLEKREPSNLNALDISNTPLEIRPLALEINRLMQQLKSTLTREQAFAANAAHELKTPLSTMKAKIQVALMQPPEEQQAAFLKIQTSIDRYDHIIKQLLTLSRTISQSSLNTNKQIAIAPIVQKTVAEMVPLALKQKVTLAFEQTSNPILNTDDVLIATALQNLIGNAIQYTHSEDTILIKLSSFDQTVFIDIIDHGPGLSEHEKALALERFTRLNSSTQGSGLGLNIAVEICQQMNGKLTLLDTPEGGLTARITLDLL